MNKENRKQIHRYSEQAEGFARWEGGVGNIEKGKGTKKLQNIHGTKYMNIKYNIRNIVNNIVITMYGAR